jgi:uncharacterized protein (TIGR02145 family)
MRKNILCFLFLLGSCIIQAQIGIGVPNPAASSVLELSSTSKGFLPPRLTTAQRDAIATPAVGLMIFNTTKNCLEWYTGMVWYNACGILDVGSIATINCAGATPIGDLISGLAANVSTAIPYTGGNGGSHAGQVVASTGVTGLTATLSSGNFAVGTGSLTYDITGTPTSSGTALFAVNIGGQSCSLSVAVAAGSIATLDCAGATPIGDLISGLAASVSTAIPYTGGDGGSHTGQVVASTGVTGLTATLTAGNFAVGTGSLTYAITGTPASSGTASFAISIGGKSCSLSIKVFVCGAKVASGSYYKGFSCHNLGADDSLDPHVPVQGIHGDYYQWGKATSVATASTPSGAIFGWNSTPAANGSWSDGSKTANDPCPAGFRVPTSLQWADVIANNTVSRTGSWADDGNFTTAIHWGPDASTQTLTLPASGYRDNADGTLITRGYAGYYWSSTENGTYANNLYFSSSFFASTGSSYRTFGISVRCVSE